MVKWPGGELSVDTEKTGYLGTGQLLEAVNTSNMSVKFKLHECFPGSRYIVTDTAMAQMMNIPASPPNAELMNTGATDEIWVFGNGTPDSHPTGFLVNCPVPVIAENTFSA